MTRDLIITRRLPKTKPTSTKANIRFVILNELKNLSQIEKEHRDAEYKSHAARIGHRKRKARSTRLDQVGLPIFKGCSDPFSTQEVTVTPRINGIITFVRDVYIPGTFLSPFMRKITQDEGMAITSLNQCANVMGGASAMRDWNQLRQGLYDEGQAWAWLSSYIPMLIRLAPFQEGKDLLATFLWMKSRSLQLLREKLSGQGCKPDLSTLLHVYWLFRADCTFCDAEAAATHIPVLLQMFDELVPPQEQIQLCFVMLFHDVELAVASLKPTFLDLENWIPHRLEPLWNKTAPYLPSDLTGCGELHPCIRSLRIRTIAIRLRWCLRFAENHLSLQTPEARHVGDMIYIWMSTRTIHDMGTLLNLSLALPKEKSRDMTQGVRLTEAAIAVAVLYVLRKSLHSSSINGVDTRDLSHIIIDRLRAFNDAALRVLTKQEHQIYREAYLWMFYLGMQHGQRVQREKLNCQTDGSDLWFEENFMNQAEELGLFTWPDIVAVLRMFVYNEYLKPNLSQWFAESVLGRFLVG